jgi:UDP-GlcNAc3NAcA epimerase
MKICTIIGARPQFIKAATVSRAIKNYPGVQEIILHTGQHFDSNMSDVFFSELDIPEPNYHLGVGGGSHGTQTGKMLERIDEILIQNKPDWVLVYGDTNSTLAGALSASKLHFPIAHVEAGLRSFNKRMPEEINRILTDHVSTVLFTPTETAVKNLTKEGIPLERIYNIGDVMYDAALFYGHKAEKGSNILASLDLKPEDFILATIHRAENTDDPQRLKLIFDALEKVSKAFKVVLPLHPRTKESLSKLNFNFNSTNICFIPPLGYLDMVKLEKNAKIIVTDSGGVQKEAYFHRRTCVTLREETEWIELVTGGFNILASNLEEVESKIMFAINNSYLFDSNLNLFGAGNAAEKIVDNLINHG